MSGDAVILDALCNDLHLAGLLSKLAEGMILVGWMPRWLLRMIGLADRLWALLRLEAVRHGWECAERMAGLLSLSRYCLSRISSSRNFSQPQILSAALGRGVV